MGRELHYRFGNNFEGNSSDDSSTDTAWWNDEKFFVYKGNDCFGDENVYNTQELSRIVKELSLAIDQELNGLDSEEDGYKYKGNISDKAECLMVYSTLLRELLRSSYKYAKISYT